MTAQLQPTAAEANLRSVEDDNRRITRGLAACCATCRTLSDELMQHASCDQLFNYLVDEKQYARAIRLAGHWLPKRKSIWWACLNVWWQNRDNKDQHELSVIDSVVWWVIDPSEASRRVAGQLATRLSNASPLALLGHAVFWSGGSVAPVDCPEVEAPSHLTGHFATSAVIGVVGASDWKQLQALRFAVEVRYAETPWLSSSNQEANDGH